MSTWNFGFHQEQYGWIMGWNNILESTSGILGACSLTVPVDDHYWITNSKGHED